MPGYKNLEQYLNMGYIGSRLPPKGKHMPIHANDAEKIYLQSKKKRLTAVLSRIDSEMSDVLSRGYKNIRCHYTESAYGSGHNNTDIFSDIVKYYNTLGWNVKNEGSGYIVLTPTSKPPTPPPNRFDLDMNAIMLGAPSGSLAFQEAMAAPKSQVERMMGALDKLKFTSTSLSPKSNVWGDVWDKVTLPFAIFWAWFKEVMK